MPQYLMFAENIYNKIKDEELFSHDCIENMNLLMTCIRREIEGTEFKLKFNFIDFISCHSGLNLTQNIFLGKLTLVAFLAINYFWSLWRIRSPDCNITFHTSAVVKFWHLHFRKTRFFSTFQTSVW